MSRQKKLQKCNRFVVDSLAVYEDNETIYKNIVPYHNWLVSWTVSPEVVGSSPIGMAKIVVAEALITSYNGNTTNL